MSKKLRKIQEILPNYEYLSKTLKSGLRKNAKVQFSRFFLFF